MVPQFAGLAGKVVVRDPRGPVPVLLGSGYRSGLLNSFRATGLVMRATGMILPGKGVRSRGSRYGSDDFVSQERGEIAGAPGRGSDAGGGGTGDPLLACLRNP